MSEQHEKQLAKLKLNKETIADLDVNSPDAVKGGANECGTKNPVSCDPHSRIGCPTPSIYCPDPKPIKGR